MKHLVPLTLALMACSPVGGGFDTPILQTTPGALTGRLVHADGTPAAGLAVALRQGTLRQTARTGSDGRFTFDAPPLGAVELAGHDGAGAGFFRPIVLEAAGLNDTADIVLAPLAELNALTTFPGIGLEERISDLDGRCISAQPTPDRAAFVCLRTRGDSDAQVLSRIDVATGAETILADVPRQVAVFGECEPRIWEVRGRIASLVLRWGPALFDLQTGRFVTGGDVNWNRSSSYCGADPFVVAGNTLRMIDHDGGYATFPRPGRQIGVGELWVNVKVRELDLDAADLTVAVREEPLVPPDLGVMVFVRPFPGGLGVGLLLVAQCPGDRGSQVCTPLGDQFAALEHYERDVAVLRAEGPDLVQRMAAPFTQDIFSWAVSNDGNEAWALEGGQVIASDVWGNPRRTWPSGTSPSHQYLVYNTPNPDRLIAYADDYLFSGTALRTLAVVTIDRPTGQTTPLPGFAASSSAGPNLLERFSYTDGDRVLLVRKVVDRVAGVDTGAPHVLVSELGSDGAFSTQPYAGEFEYLRGPGALVSSPDNTRQALFAVDAVSGRAQVYEGSRGAFLDDLPQRTFLAGGHQQPVYSADGQWLYFFADDPVTNYPQLFRLEVAPAP